MLVGIGEAGGQIGGHAVAVHYAKNNQLRIFDPNIGVFSCTSKGELKAALLAMIDVGWVKILGWQLDKEFGYSLFESRHSVVDVKPGQSAVQYTVSMEATANQALERVTGRVTWLLGRAAERAIEAGSELPLVRGPEWSPGVRQSRQSSASRRDTGQGLVIESARAR